MRLFGFIAAEAGRQSREFISIVEAACLALESFMAKRRSSSARYGRHLYIGAVEACPKAHRSGQKSRYTRMSVAVLASERSDRRM